MEPRTIETREQYEAALAMVEELMGRETAAGSEECLRLEQLAQLIEEYEKAEFPIDPPSPSEVGRFRQEQEASMTTEHHRWRMYLSEPDNRRVEEFWMWLTADFRENIPLPLALPGAEAGSVQLAWDTERYHLDVTLPRGGDEEWFFMDRRASERRDGVLPADAGSFRVALRLVAASSSAVQ